MTEPIVDETEIETLTEQDVSWTGYASATWDHPYYREQVAALRAHARLRMQPRARRWLKTLAEAVRAIREREAAKGQGLSLQIPRERTTS